MVDLDFTQKDQPEYVNRSPLKQVSFEEQKEEMKNFHKNLKLGFIERNYEERQHDLDNERKLKEKAIKDNERQKNDDS